MDKYQKFKQNFETWTNFAIPNVYLFLIYVVFLEEYTLNIFLHKFYNFTYKLNIFLPLQRTGLFASNNKARIGSPGSPSQYASFREFTLSV